MAALTFGTLKSSLLAIIGRAPASICYSLTTTDINENLRLMCMESTATLTVAASISMTTESITDFLAVESIYLDSTPPALLRPATAQNVKASFQAAQVPTQFAIVDGNILLNGAGGSDDIELRYYARQAELSADEDTNDILTYHQGIYIYGALYHHARLIRDYQAAEGYGLDYERAMRQAQTQDRADRMSGEPVEPYAGTTP